MVVGVGVEPTRQFPATGYQPGPLSDQATYDFIKDKTLSSIYNLSISLQF